MITIAITTVLVTIILGLVTIVSVSLFSTAKYSNQDRIAKIEAQQEEWAAVMKAGPKDLNDRIIALENNAGIMIGKRR